MAFGKEGNPAAMAGSLSFFNPVKLKRKTPYRKLTVRGSRKFPIIKIYLETSSSEHKESDILTEYSAIPLKESKIFR